MTREEEILEKNLDLAEEIIKAINGTSTDAIRYMCCDCLHGGPCCDYSENEKCEFWREDGSCWEAYRSGKLDKSRWKGCSYCTDPAPYRDCVIEDGLEQFLCSRDGFFGDCYINTRKIEYCPYCGRPLTDSAWLKLDRRLNN